MPCVLHQPVISESGTETIMSVDHSHAFHDVWKMMTHEIHSAVDIPAAMSDITTPDKERGKRWTNMC